MKICCACNEEKELKHFYVNNTMADGYFARCKKCMREKKLCKKGRPFGSTYDYKETRKKSVSNGYKNSFLELRLVNTSKKDYIDTYEFLKRIGYNLSESIHEQFCEKHGLTPSEPKEFKHHYSPKDCGMN